MKSIFITGANGVIGSQILKMLSDVKEYDLYASYFMSAENLTNCDNTKLMKMDLRKEMKCKEKMDVVIHCAASIPLTFEDQEAIENNKLIDKNVIDFALQNNSRLIYCSTSSIYNGRSGEWLENEELEPESSYARQKLSSEKRIVSEFSDYIILRINAPYHYSQKNNTVLKKFIVNASTGTDLVLYGDGIREQNFIHAKDIANLINKALHKSTIVGKYNVGSDRNIRMKDLAELIISLTNSKSKIIFAGLPDPNESIVPRLNTIAVKRDFEWKCEIPLEEGIKEWLKALKN